jgi:hypothetical protein
MVFLQQLQVAEKMIRFWPRKPRFPVIIDTGIELIGANTAAECSKQLARAKIANGELSTAVIDATAEGFSFHPESKLITPIAIKKRWKKSEIISLYNTRRKPEGTEYSSTSLGNKSTERVVRDIVHLLNHS